MLYFFLYIRITRRRYLNLSFLDIIFIRTNFNNDQIYENSKKLYITL